MGRHVQSLAPFLVATLATLLAGGAACTKGPELTEEQKRIAKTIKPAYDETTGRLKTLTADRDGDGKTDSWLHMDGAKLVSAEYDTDQDGVSGDDAADNAVGATNARVKINNVLAESTTNEFSEAIPGVVFTVFKKDENATVVLDMSADATALKATAGKFISAYNDLV